MRVTESKTKVLVFIQNEDEGNWLSYFRFKDFGFEAVSLSLLDLPSGIGLPTHRLPETKTRKGTVSDFAAMVGILQTEQPAMCLSLGPGVNTKLLRAACEIEAVSMFSFISRAADFNDLSIEDPSPPHVFFLGGPALLTRALSDPRYGRTLLPVMQSVNGKQEKAASQILSFMRDFAQGRVRGTPQISIIIPAFNEASNLDRVCDQLLQVFANDTLSFEILIIDDASSDETYDAAVRQMWKSPSIRAFRKQSPRGMGNAVKYGFERARASVIAVTMADGSDQVERIPEMYRAVVDQGFGLVIGCRYRHPENFQSIPFLYRFFSRCFRVTARAVVGLRLADYTNAFRVFDRRIFTRYGAESGGFEISPEITFKAWFATHSVGEIDVRQLKRASGQSKFSFVRAGPGYGKILIKAVVNRLTGRWFTLDW